MHSSTASLGALLLLLGLLASTAVAESVMRPDLIPGRRPGDLPGRPGKEGGQIKVYNLSDGIVLARSHIADVLYSTLALEPGKTGYLDCEFVWYEIEFFAVNTNKHICSTGQPVNVYCGNAVVLEGSAATGNYTC